MSARVVASIMAIALPTMAQHTGAPYSAVRVSQNVQTLANGTRIGQPEQKTLIYRDSQGRTRTEYHPTVPASNPNAFPSPLMINILDPVAGLYYVLDTRKKIATRDVDTPGTIGPGAPAGWPQPKIESLGTQVIEGLLCDGNRITNTTPAGAVGNDRDIVSVSETWISQELHIQVLSKATDPRRGEFTTKLTEVSRAEPDPALFVVPADYTIEDKN